MSSPTERPGDPNAASGSSGRSRVLGDVTFWLPIRRAGAPTPTPPPPAHMTLTLEYRWRLCTDGRFHTSLLASLPAPAPSTDVRCSFPSRTTQDRPSLPT